jgi:hypothetical protein
MADDPITPPEDVDPDDDLGTRRPRVVWLAVPPAIIALVGGLLPWFAPTGTKGGSTAVDIPAAYSWQSGRIGFLAPLTVIGVAICVLGPRLAPSGESTPARPLGRDGMAFVIGGIAALAVLGIAWYFLPASYLFSDGRTWTTLQHEGITMRRGPQPGYFVTIAAAVAAIGCGAALVVAGRREPA